MNMGCSRNMAGPLVPERQEHLILLDRADIQQHVILLSDGAPHAVQNRPH